jgi:uncharacterized membrane protein
VQRIELDRTVSRAPDVVFDRLLDFEGYPRYSEYLRSVSARGDREYGLTFGWWKLSYDTRARVTDRVRPRRIDWTVVSDLEANGSWLVEDRGQNTRIRFQAAYDPGSLGPGAVSLPLGVSLDWIRTRAEGLIQEEANRVMDRVVADLDQQARSA